MTLTGDEESPKLTGQNDGLRCVELWYLTVSCSPQVNVVILTLAVAAGVHCFDLI